MQQFLIWLSNIPPHHPVSPFGKGIPPYLTGVGILHTLAEMAFFRGQLPLLS
jgi:hypothetical protein